VNWEKLDLHLENLMPGIVLLTVALITWKVDLGPLTDHAVVLAAAFVAFAYMVGALGNILARLLLDFVSENTIRPTMIKIFARRKLVGTEDRSFNGINKRYSELITAALTCGNPGVEKEIRKRRQTARLCRSALCPAWLGVVALWSSNDGTPAELIGLLIAVYGTMLILYGYSEVTIFQESFRGECIKKEKGVRGVTHNQIGTG
jgi:hypothetical protein